MEPLLTADDLAYLTALDEAEMRSVCTVLRSPPPDRDGGTTTILEPEPVGNPVPCRLRRLGGGSRPAEVWGREGDEPPAEVYLPLGVAVLDDDMIEVATGGQVVRFEVQGTPFVDDYATSLRVPVWRED